jgi:hypothetical protein
MKTSYNDVSMQEIAGIFACMSFQNWLAEDTFFEPVCGRRIG